MKKIIVVIGFINLLSISSYCQSKLVYEIYGIDTSKVTLDILCDSIGDIIGLYSSHSVAKKLKNGLTILHSPIDSSLITDVIFKWDSLSININFIFKPYNFYFQYSGNYIKFFERDFENGGSVKSIIVDEFYIGIIFDKDYRIDRLFIKKNNKKFIYWFPVKNQKFGIPK